MNGRLTLLRYSPDMSRVGIVVAVALALLALAAPASTSRSPAAAGDELLPTRSTSRDRAYALEIQRDGRVVAAGRSVSPGWSFALARYTGKGKLDPTFGRGGKVVTNIRRTISEAAALAIQRDGRIVAAGGAGALTYFALARYTARGALDRRFGRDGKVLTSFGPLKRIGAAGRALAIQADGKAVVAGWSGKPGSDAIRFALARYTTRGILDPGFGRGGKVVGPDGDAWAVAIQRDGKVVAAGTNAVGRSAFALARYRADGKVDPSFGSGGKVLTDFGFWSKGRALAIQADGRLVVAGQALGSTGDDFALARYTADGSLDPSFGSGGKVVTNFGSTPVNCPDCVSSDEWASAVAVQPDGKIVAVGRSDIRGEFADRSGTPLDDFALVRYNADGSLDPSFGSHGTVVTPFAGNTGAEDVRIQADGRIVVAGGGGGYFALARYTADGSLDPSFGRGGKVVTTFVSG